jgi:hypothetical protein
LIPLFGLLFLFRWLNRRARSKQSDGKSSRTDSIAPVAPRIPGVDCDLTPR